MVDVVKYFGDEVSSKSISPLSTSYLNHPICFAAEESRLNGKVVDLQEFSDKI